jgi:hypothetical protein
MTWRLIAHHQPYHEESRPSATLVATGAWVTAWQRAGPEDVSTAAQPSSSLLIGGTRAPPPLDDDLVFFAQAAAKSLKP